jgi:hypothetical protein
LWAIDANGNRISPAVGFATDARDCGEGGSGHQIVTVHWKANYAGAYGENWTLVDADKPYQYDFGRSAVWYSDCKTTKISVYVHDVKGDPVNGVRIHISSDGWEADSFPTGENFPDGWTDFRLADEAKAATWSLWVVGAGGERISPIVKLTTDDVNCEEGGSGHQVATINWTKKF